MHAKSDSWGKIQRCFYALKYNLIRVYALLYYFQSFGCTSSSPWLSSSVFCCWVILKNREYHNNWGYFHFLQVCEFILFSKNVWLQSGLILQQCSCCHLDFEHLTKCLLINKRDTSHLHTSPHIDTSKCWPHDFYSLLNRISQRGAMKASGRPHLVCQ